MNYGVEFTFKDGKKDWYDPIDKDKVREEMDNDDIGEAHIWVNVYDYWIDKDKVESYKFYEVGEE